MGDDWDISDSDRGGTGDDARLRALIRDAAPPREPTDAAMALGRFWAQSAPSETRRERRTVVLPSRPAGMGRLWFAAAAVSLVAVLAVVILMVHPGVNVPQFREIATAAGSRSTLTLRDGTRVILGPASRIRIPVDFGRVTRSVELDGEGYFAVVHDTKHPFAVHTGGATVTDVGTEFDVRNYDGDAGVRVAVLAGAISLRSTLDSPGRSMRAGEMATVVNGLVTVTRDANLTPLTAWVQGGLVFNATPLREALRDIGRTFGVEIAVPDTTVGRLPITASFSDEPLDEILAAVTQAVGARYERTGKTIVVRRGAAKAENHTRARRAPLATASATWHVTNE